MEPKFSEEFLNRSSDTCIVLTTVSSVILDEDLENREFISSASITDQRSSILSGFSFYFSGAEKKLNIILHYYVSGCEDNPDEMGKHAIVFNINDIRKLVR